MTERPGSVPSAGLSDEGLIALYRLSDPITWAQVVRDYRALSVADTAARKGREAVRQLLGAESMTSVDRLVRAARDTRADDVRHALALALQPAIMKATLIDAAGGGWAVDPPTGMVYRLYTDDGTELTNTPGARETARYRRSVWAEAEAYKWGVTDLRVDYDSGDGDVFITHREDGSFTIAARGWMRRALHGKADNPAEALRQALDEPLASAL